MKTKLVLWGKREADKRVLIALELRAPENMVDVYLFPDESVTEAFNQQMMQDWRDGVEVVFPESHEKHEKELTVSEPLLPEGVKAEREDLVQRAQTEWHFIVLSSKLNQAYQSELDNIKDKVDQLTDFDQKAWDTLKQFWDKVQEQVRERNLFKEHADSLRDHTNALFTQLKKLRSKLDEAFKQQSLAFHDQFMASLAEIEEKVNNGARLQPLFDSLKKLQRQFRETKFTRDHRAKVWERLDKSFKLVKEKRFGSKSDDRSPVDRINRRYQGLISAIEKMERSIKRDKDDLDFQNKKIQRTDGQLEAQIRQAKILMINERIRSKEEKLKEMLQTKTELEKRMVVLKEKEAKREAREQLEEAKKAAELKIKEEMKMAAEKRAEESDKLEKAAEAITGKVETPSKDEQSESIPEEPTQTTKVEVSSSPAEVVSNPIEEEAAPVQEESHSSEKQPSVEVAANDEDSTQNDIQEAISNNEGANLEPSDQENEQEVSLEGDTVEVNSEAEEDVER